MIVAETSAWVHLLRRTGSPVHLTLRRLIDERAELAVTEIVVAEILGGARTERDLANYRDRLLAFPVLALRGLESYMVAADLYRTCRRQGVTPELSDLLVAVPTIEAGAELLHADADFDRIAEHTELRIYPVRPGG